MSYLTNTTTSVSRSEALNADKNQNIHIGRRVKRKGFEGNMLYKICDMLSPKTTISGVYKPDAYNDTNFEFYVVDGFRIVPQNQQDIMQLCHLSFDEFGQLFLKALSGPKVFPMVNHLRDDGVWIADPTLANNDNELPPNIIDSQIPYTEYGTYPVPEAPPGEVPQTNLTQQQVWYKNQNMELLLSEYVVKYTITNQSEHVMYFEFMELSPKQIISDRYNVTPESDHPDTAWVNSYTISQSGFQDPLSCFKRDCDEANLIGQNDYGLSGPILAEEVKPSSNAQMQPSTRGLSLDHRIAKEVRSKYNILNKKIVSVNPGNQVDYKFAINGFQRHCDWHYATHKLSITRTQDLDPNVPVGSKVVFESIPTFIKQTKFLTIRSWVPSHVRAVVDGVENLAFGQGKYTITASRHMSVRAIPRAPNKRHIQITDYTGYNFDPDKENNAEPLDTFNTETFINEDGNQEETVTIQ